MKPISLSPSGASRWLKCTASPQFIAVNAGLIPVEEAPSYTQEGTDAHVFAASALLLGPGGEIPDAQMAKHIAEYAAFVAMQLDEQDTLEVESKLPLFYMPDRHGYVDAAGIHKDRITVIDFKYGQGLSVSAYQNKQMLIYARSLVEQHQSIKFSDKTLVSLVIYQPRVFQGEKITRWNISMEELFSETDKIAEQAMQIQEDPSGGVFYPSEETCRFCPASSFCRARATWLLGDLQVIEEMEAGAELTLEEDSGQYLLNLKMDPMPAACLPAAENLTPEIRSALVAKAPEVIKWLRRLMDWSEAMLLNGRKEEVPGFKLITGNAGNRYWNDEEEALRLLKQKLPKEERVNTKVISPAQAEALLKGKDLSTAFQNKLLAVTSKKSGSYRMVPLDHKGTEVHPVVTAENEFSKLVDELDESILCDMLE
jgi:hypothetical protein